MTIASRMALKEAAELGSLGVKVAGVATENALAAYMAAKADKATTPTDAMLVSFLGAIAAMMSAQTALLSTLAEHIAAGDEEEGDMEAALQDLLGDENGQS